jgi:hypothetical protein
MQQVRKPYEPPRLVRHGNVVPVTGIQPSGPSDVSD